MAARSEQAVMAAEETGLGGFANAGVEGLRGKRVVVLGLSRSGAAAIDLLLDSGARVTGTDSRSEEAFGADAGAWRARGVTLALGANPTELAATADLVVTSPGIPAKHPLLAAARDRGVRVWSELELGARAARAPIAAITGTNGKTTTTHITGAIFAAAGIPTAVAGNVGYPLSRAAREVPANGRLAVEVSSYQLEWTEAFHPSVAVILNLTPDHLERHGDLEGYRRAKGRIFERMTRDDTLVLVADDAALDAYRGEARCRVLDVSTSRRVERGAWLESGTLWARVDERDAAPIVAAAELRIPGAHNVANALAAAAAALAAGAPLEAARAALTRFESLPHRLEPVALVNGVRLVNDSKSTNVDSLLVALRAFAGPIVLIAGGRDKGTGLGEVAALLRERARAAVLIGEAADRFDAAFRGATATRRAETLEDAARAALEIAQPGDTVLLSPACASFDMFRDYEHRGDAFREIARRIAAERSTPS